MHYSFWYLKLKKLKIVWRVLHRLANVYNIKLSQRWIYTLQHRLAAESVEFSHCAKCDTPHRWLCQTRDPRNTSVSYSVDQ